MQSQAADGVAADHHDQAINGIARAAAIQFDDRRGIGSGLGPAVDDDGAGNFRQRRQELNCVRSCAGKAENKQVLIWRVIAIEQGLAKLGSVAASRAIPAAATAA